MSREDSVPGATYRDGQDVQVPNPTSHMNSRTTGLFLQALLHEHVHEEMPHALKNKKYTTHTFRNTFTKGTTP